MLPVAVLQIMVTQVDDNNCLLALLVYEDNTDWVKRCMLIDIEGTRQRGSSSGIVSEGIWRVLACLMRMLRIRISGG